MYRIFAIGATVKVVSPRAVPLTKHDPPKEIAVGALGTVRKIDIGRISSVLVELDSGESVYLEPPQLRVHIRELE
jgi:hypothetical protein